MMKTFTTILCMLPIFYGFSQNAPIDFETTGNGANWTWTVFENNSNPPLEIISNPDPSGINASQTVAKFTALQSGQPWAGCESAQGSDLGEFVLDQTNSTITIMVWKDVISDVGIKLVSSTFWSEGELKIPNTVTNAWEKITFDFSNFNNPPAGNGVLNQIVIFPDFDLSGRTQDNIIYFDNITFSDGTLSVSDSDFRDNFMIYPSPASNVLNLDSKISIDDVAVFNMLGQKVLSEKIGATKSQIDVSGLSPGIYLVKINSEGQTAIYQVIKE